MSSLAQYLEQEEFCKLRAKHTGTDLHRAIVSGDPEEISQLLHNGVPMEVQSSHGLTPLQVACVNGDLRTATALIRAGCSVNSPSGCSRKSALSFAAFSGNVELFEFLINQGGRIDLVDDEGRNVLHEAVLGGSKELVKLLSRSGSGLRKQKNSSGRTALHLAAFMDASAEIVRAALHRSDDVDLKKDLDENGRSVLELAKLHSVVDWEQLQAVPAENLAERS